LKGHKVRKELIESLIQRLNTSTLVISNIAENIITKDNFPERHEGLQDTIKANKTIIDEANKELRSNR